MRHLFPVLAACMLSLLVTGISFAGFCTQCGAKLSPGDKFCSNCGHRVAKGAGAATTVAGKAASTGDGTARAVPEHKTEKKIRLEDIHSSKREDELALGFLKTVIQGKPYLGNCSRDYIYKVPEIIDLEVCSKQVLKARPPQQKYLYNLRIRVKRERNDTSWFGSSFQYVWEVWCLRVQLNKDRILTWVPKSYYDDPFVSEPRIKGPAELSPEFALLSKWFKQRDENGDIRNRKVEESGLQNYQVVYDDEKIKIYRSFPFLHGDNVITSLLHLCGTRIGGNKIDLVSLKVVNKLDVAQNLRLKTSLQGVSHEAVSSFVLSPGASKLVGLSPVLKMDSLHLEEKMPSAIYMAVSGSDGGIIFEDTVRVSLMPKNDFILDRKMFPFLAVFVTPHDRLIDQLVIAAGNKVQGRAMAGYQKSMTGVIEEVMAIYDTIASLGVHYRSNTSTFLNDARAVTQRVTFPSESLAGKGANCIDGAVLFASCFESDGLDTSIIIGPGHAFVSVYVDPNRQKRLCVETTAVGTADFKTAVTIAGKTFATWQQQGVLVEVDIKKARKAGITPFPYVSNNPLVADRLRELAK